MNGLKGKQVFGILLMFVTHNTKEIIMFMQITDGKILTVQLVQSRHCYSFPAEYFITLRLWITEKYTALFLFWEAE